MEALPHKPNGHIFIDPDVIETHIKRQQPIPEGTIKLLVVLQILSMSEIELSDDVYNQINGLDKL